MCVVPSETDVLPQFPSSSLCIAVTIAALTGVPHCVRSDCGRFTTLAKPKSAILIDESSVSLRSNKFSG